MSTQLKSFLGAKKSVSAGPVATLMSAKAPQRDYVIVWLASAADRIHAIEAGVPSKFLTVLAEDMDVSQNTLYGWAGIAPATAKRKLSSHKPLSLDEGERALGIAQLVGQVEALVRASGNGNEFDARRWTAQWLGQPNPALGGRPPGRYMNTAEGRAIVSDLISMGAGGGFA